jgi:hypothetical protein
LTILLQPSQRFAYLCLRVGIDGRARNCDMSPEQKLLFKNYDTCAYYCHSCHERNANCTCLCPNIPNPGVSSFTLVNNHSRLNRLRTMTITASNPAFIILSLSLEHTTHTPGNGSKSIVSPMACQSTISLSKDCRSNKCLQRPCGLQVQHTASINHKA